jgi:hypothetical protein
MGVLSQLDLKTGKANLTLSSNRCPEQIIAVARVLLAPERIAPQGGIFARTMHSTGQNT